MYFAMSCNFRESIKWIQIYIESDTWCTMYRAMNCLALLERNRRITNSKIDNVSRQDILLSKTLVILGSEMHYIAIDSSPCHDTLIFPSQQLFLLFIRLKNCVACDTVSG